MYNAKQVVLERIQALPDDVSMADILKEVIYLSHIEPLLREGFVPTAEQAAIIERFCTRFNKSTLLAMVKYLDIERVTDQGVYKSLLAANILRAGYTYEDALRIDHDILKAFEESEQES